MTLPNMGANKPHVPTLVIAIVAAVLLLGLYHLTAKGRRR